MRRYEYMVFMLIVTRKAEVSEGLNCLKEVPCRSFPIERVTCQSPCDLPAAARFHYSTLRGEQHIKSAP